MTKLTVTRNQVNCITVMSDLTQDNYCMAHLLLRVDRCTTCVTVWRGSTHTCVQTTPSSTRSSWCVTTGTWWTAPPPTPSTISTVTLGKVGLPPATSLSPFLQRFPAWKQSFFIRWLLAKPPSPQKKNWGVSHKISSQILSKIGV